MWGGVAGDKDDSEGTEGGKGDEGHQDARHTSLSASSRLNSGMSLMDELRRKHAARLSAHPHTPSGSSAPPHNPNDAFEGAHDSKYSAASPAGMTAREAPASLATAAARGKQCQKKMSEDEQSMAVGSRHKAFFEAGVKHKGFAGF